MHLILEMGNNNVFLFILSSQSNVQYVMICRCLCSLLTEFRESGHCSQDSMREDSFVSSTGPDQFSETAIFSGSDSETHSPATPSQELAEQPLDSVLSDSDAPPTSIDPPLSQENHINQSPSEVCISTSSELHLDLDTHSTVSELVECVEPVEGVQTTCVQESGELKQEEKEAESLEKSSSESSVHPIICRSTSMLSRKLSTDSLSVSICRQIAFSWSTGLVMKSHHVFHTLSDQLIKAIFFTDGNSKAVIDDEDFTDRGNAVFAPEWLFV